MISEPLKLYVDDYHNGKTNPSKHIGMLLSWQSYRFVIALVITFELLPIPHLRNKNLEYPEAQLFRFNS